MGIFQGFMVLNDLAENVKADARYAGADNFTGQVVDGYRAPKVVGTEELGAALGKSVVSLAAITDPALALAFLQALEDPQRYEGALEDLANRTKRVRQRQLEEKAHQKNLQRGKRRRQPGGPAGHHKAGPGTPVAQSKRQAKPAVRKQAPGSGSAVRKHGKKSHGGAEL